MTYNCISADVGLIGVGFGGFAALRALLERGLRVAAVEEHAWIGGQVTSQALCVLDEYHDPIGEDIGYSRRYSEFREALREHYRSNYRLSSTGAAQLYLNPGNAMNSHLVAEAHIAHLVLRRWLEPYIKTGQLILKTGWIAESATYADNRLKSVLCRPADPASPERMEIQADFFLDGTEAGDLYPLVPLPHRLGADGPAFGELHATARPDPAAIQSCTACFAVEFVPGGNFTIPEPADYQEWKAAHGPFHLDAPGASAGDPSLMFRRKEKQDGRMLPPAFYYRCIVDCRNFDDPEKRYSRSIINTGCNDFYGEAIVGPGVDASAVFEKAKGLSRAYLYWLQTEAPRDDGGFGYPELRPCPEVTGTPDGIAMAPYIREGRRLQACRTIVEEDIAIHAQSGVRAAHFDDSVGLGCFVIDIHRRTGASSGFCGGVHCRPYQIPLSAMASRELENFAVAGKCIGTTQITNGAYRLHNIEWAIGEAAGELAAFCLEDSQIRNPCLEGRKLLEFQRRLVSQGVPVFWYEDVGFDDAGFEAVQMLSIRRIWPASRQHLRFDAAHSVARSLQTIKNVFANLDKLGVNAHDLEELVLTAHGTRKVDVAHRILDMLDRRGWPELPGDNTDHEYREGDVEEDGIPEPLA